ncbi:hypothetical protein [Allosphingosinicella deserti]|uniref:Uncharacterized protein n=1 Tax=Allosphingosinicella deserti TaxID=2116704 RepID=A0A2P7QPJ7_9SPHN|nr:hypothetical protein [Sphingomonas deserti]PSJ39874.1 hypothetical protein C7I55_15060 [Sphingomonas deserti]
MTDGEMMARMLGGLETSGQPHGIELTAVRFPELASAQAFTDQCEQHGLSVVVRRRPLMSDSQWEELLREVGMPGDEDVPSREEFRDWHVDAAANLILTEETVANIWDVLAGRRRSSADIFVQ